MLDKALLRPSFVGVLRMLGLPLRLGRGQDLSRLCGWLWKAFVSYLLSFFCDISVRLSIASLRPPLRALFV